MNLEFWFLEIPMVLWSFCIVFFFVKAQEWRWTDNIPMNFTLFDESIWAYGEPNAPLKSNCVVQFPWEKWGDEDCDSEDAKYAFFCGPLGTFAFVFLFCQQKIAPNMEMTVYNLFHQ